MIAIGSIFEPVRASEKFIERKVEQVAIIYL